MDVHFSKYGAHKFLLLHQTKYVQLLLRHTVRCLMIFHSHTQNAASAVDFSSLRVAAWQVWRDMNYFVLVDLREKDWTIMHSGAFECACWVTEHAATYEEKPVAKYFRPDSISKIF